jgi:hypothetical protein
MPSSDLIHEEQQLLLPVMGQATGRQLKAITAHFASIIKRRRPRQTLLSECLRMFVLPIRVRLGDFVSLVSPNALDVLDQHVHILRDEPRRIQSADADVFYQLRDLLETGIQQLHQVLLLAELQLR